MSLWSKFVMVYSLSQPKQLSPMTINKTVFCSITTLTMKECGLNSRFQPADFYPYFTRHIHVDWSIGSSHKIYIEEFTSS